MQNNHYYYSASTNSFYPIFLKSEYEKAGTLPTDLIEVNDDIFDEFSQNKDGFYRSSDENGYPIWIEIPPPTQQELDQKKEAENTAFLAFESERTEDEIKIYERMRDRNRADADDLAMLELLEDYSIDLKKVTKQEGWPLEVEWPIAPEF